MHNAVVVCLEGLFQAASGCLYTCGGTSYNTVHTSSNYLHIVASGYPMVVAVMVLSETLAFVQLPLSVEVVVVLGM